MWYDRAGKPIEGGIEGFIKWIGHFKTDDANDPLLFNQYRRVASTTLRNGALVSTVWMGLDHNFMTGGPPLIFETIVFDTEEDGGIGDALCQERYSTEVQAQEGHEEMVLKCQRAIDGSVWDEYVHDCNPRAVRQALTDLAGFVVGWGGDWGDEDKEEASAEPGATTD